MAKEEKDLRWKDCFERSCEAADVGPAHGVNLLKGGA